MGSCWFYRSALGLILFSDNIKLVFLQIFDYRQNRHKPKLKLAESQLTQNNQSFFGGELLNQTDSDPLRFQIAQSQRQKVEIAGTVFITFVYKPILTQFVILHHEMGSKSHEEHFLVFAYC